MSQPALSSDSEPKLAVSIGEPAGVGPDIILSAWQMRLEQDIPDFVVIGREEVLHQRAEELGIQIATRTVEHPDRVQIAEDAISVINIQAPMACGAGKPQNSNAAGVVEAIETAVKLTLDGTFDGVVTCPINKKNLYESGFKFPGHTEYLADLGQKLTGQETFPVMMLAGPELRTIPVTIHIALEDVKNTLDKQLILKTARITSRDLIKQFGIANPKLAIAGLNPHAGEEGSMGREEIEYINAAVEELQLEGINAIGPLPADTMFHKRARENYDVALCMYHDQALIPAKTLGFDDAVNVTLGLPFIRTSPDHGTAYDIAGTGKAKPDSFIAALRMARDMAIHR